MPTSIFTGDLLGTEDDRLLRSPSIREAPVAFNPCTMASSMRALLELPLSLLPTFLVPIITATHVIIFVRLGRRSRGRLEVGVS
jgi:hypothetical protein